MEKTAFYPANNSATGYGVPFDLAEGDWVSPFKNLNAESAMPLSSLYIGTEGDLVVVLAGNPQEPIMFKNHSAGYAETPIIRVVKEGTTAGDFVALYY